MLTTTITGAPRIPSRIIGLVAVLLGQFMLVLDAAYLIPVLSMVAGITVAATLLRTSH